jgi:hypothetical protein
VRKLHFGGWPVFRMEFGAGGLVTVPLACACRAAFRVSGPGTALSEPGRDRDSDGDRESAAGSCSSRNSSPGVAEAVLELQRAYWFPTAVTTA